VCVKKINLADRHNTQTKTPILAMEDGSQSPTQYHEPAKSKTKPKRSRYPPLALSKTSSSSSSPPPPPPPSQPPTTTTASPPRKRYQSPEPEPEPEPEAEDDRDQKGSDNNNNNNNNKKSKTEREDEANTLVHEDPDPNYEDHDLPDYEDLSGQGDTTATEGKTSGDGESDGKSKVERELEAMVSVKDVINGLQDKTYSFVKEYETNTMANYTLVKTSTSQPVSVFSGFFGGIKAMNTGVHGCLEFAMKPGKAMKEKIDCAGYLVTTDDPECVKLMNELNDAAIAWMLERNICEKSPLSNYKSGSVSKRLAEVKANVLRSSVLVRPKEFPAKPQYFAMKADMLKNVFCRDGMIDRQWPEKFGADKLALVQEMVAELEKQGTDDRKQGKSSSRPLKQFNCVKTYNLATNKFEEDVWRTPIQLSALLVGVVWKTLTFRTGVDQHNNAHAKIHFDIARYYTKPKGGESEQNTLPGGE